MLKGVVRNEENIMNSFWVLYNFHIKKNELDVAMITELPVFLHRIFSICNTGSVKIF